MRGQGYADTSIADGNAVRLCLTAVCREAVPAVERLKMHFDLGGVEQVMSRRHELNPFEVQWGGWRLTAAGTTSRHTAVKHSRTVSLSLLPRPLVNLLTY